MLSTNRHVSRNAGNEGRSALKTPARALLAENRVAQGTVHKGKGTILQTPFQSKTPFQVQVQKPLFTAADTQLKGGSRAPARPLLDKTPFPNRIATAGNNNEIRTPFIHNVNATPDSALRPSSTRRHIRVPRHSQKFETPVNTGNHWDVGESSEDAIQMQLPEPPKTAVVEDDFDEIEYMAPNTLDLSYQPPLDFDLPDYKVLGKAIMDASRNGTLFYDPDSLPPAPVFEIRPEDVEKCDIDLELPLISDDDDPFLDIRRDVKSVPPPPATKDALKLKSKPALVKPNTRPIPLPASTRTVIPRVPSSRSAVLVSKISRPGTSSSVRAPSRTTSRAAMVSTSKTTGARPRPGSNLSIIRPALTTTAKPATSAPTKTSSTFSSKVLRPASTAVASTSTTTMTRPAPSAGSRSALTTTVTRPTATAGSRSASTKPIHTTLVRSNSTAATLAKANQVHESDGGVIELNIDVAAEDMAEDFMFDV